MTEEERYADGDETLTAAGEAPSSVDQKKIPVTDFAIPLSASSAGFTGSADSPCASTFSPAESTSGGCPLSGDELRFLQILLYGGDLQSFLSEKHLMASVLAEAVNEQLYDEFADTVIEFNENTPVIVDDYRNDLKGMIPS